MLESLSPLLKPKSANPDARLISLHHGDIGNFVGHLKRERLRPWMPIGVEMPDLSDTRSQYTTTYWDEVFPKLLNHHGAPLGMQIVENSLTIPFPFRIDNTVVRLEADEPVPDGMPTDWS
jgi:hypothetical protein